jgi:hypothetical protein
MPHALPRLPAAAAATAAARYKRILAVTQESIVTLNPQDFTETNVWLYETEFVEIAPSMKSDSEFIITTKKAGHRISANFLAFHPPRTPHSCGFARGLAAKSRSSLAHGLAAKSQTCKAICVGPWDTRA